MIDHAFAAYEPVTDSGDWPADVVAELTWPLTFLRDALRDQRLTIQAGLRLAIPQVECTQRQHGGTWNRPELRPGRRAPGLVPIAGEPVPCPICR